MVSSNTYRVSGENLHVDIRTLEMSTHFKLHCRNDHGHLAVNPLSPNIHIQILQTGLYTFPKEYVKRIW